MKRYIKYILVIINLICIYMILSLGVLLYKNILNYDNVKITYKNQINSNYEYLINISYNDSNTKMYCSNDLKQWKEIDKCNYYLKSGKQTIYLKNKYNIIKYDYEIKENYEGTFSSSLDNIEEYYLALNGTKKIEFKFDYPDNFDKNIFYKVDDEDIIKIENDTMYGLKVGTTYITARLNDGNRKKYKIIVTDIIKPAQIDENKPSLPCGIYSEEDNILLDKILVSRIKEAGEGTRGGVISAARFITLEFPYNISYFGENGRLKNHGMKPYIDGEGRYYHKGLYLNESKYKDLVINASSSGGPKIWGCSLYSNPNGRSQPNGFDCSGFVTWTMFNGGFDVGDVGAGDFLELSDDLSDLGKHNNITTEYMKNGNYKVGDFIGKNGHAALIIGIDDKNIYTAESLGPGLRAKTYERYTGIVNSPILSYIIEMDDIYPNGSGIYKNMWN